MNILITGGAGFIGAALAHRLLDDGHRVQAIDDLNDYYDVALKQARLQRLSARHDFTFHKLNIADRAAVEAIFRNKQFDCVVNLAAQAGVRHSLENPAAYIDANLVGFGNILEGCRHNGSENGGGVKHLVYASSSSVYGANRRLPFAECDPVDHPLSLYAATKKANELMAHTYAHLYRLPCTGLRFFTVYGPWGRPDMAFFRFTERMLAGRPIPVYNHGNSIRDFTYIDDVVEGVARVLARPPQPDSDAAAASDAPCRVYNLGNGRQIRLMDAIHALENALGVTARCEMLPMQAGDVAATEADVGEISRDFGFRPATDLAVGLAAFARWYRHYYDC